MVRVAHNVPTVDEFDHWHRREHLTKVGLAISLVALLISGAAFIYPIARTQLNEWNIAERYVRALVTADPRGSGLASGVASEGSAAYRYAKMVGLVWAAVTEGGLSPSTVDDGNVDGGFGEYTVCPPKIDIFGAECSIYADFEYSVQGRVSRFTVDGIAVEQLIVNADYENSATDSKDSNQIVAYKAGQLRDPEFTSRIVLLWFQRIGTNTSSRTPITVDKVYAQDSNVEYLDFEATYFPVPTSYYGSHYAAVRVPDETQFLFVCWSGVPEGEDACDWVYRIG